MATGERRPWDDADAGGFTVWDHFTLFFAVEEGVVVLHRYEFSPAVELGDVLELGELPCPHGGGADIADSVEVVSLLLGEDGGERGSREWQWQWRWGRECLLSGGHEVVKCAHSLFRGSAVVVAMDLENIDVAGPEPFQ